MVNVPTDEAVNFRYDIVTVIKNSEITKENRKEFSAKVKDHIVKDCIGDSLAITGMKGMLKVHWHADIPDDVLKVLRQYGEVLSHEVEDMKEQYEAFKAKKKN
jgi:dihydroxyacetone kinase-like predicted kinase